MRRAALLLAAAVLVLTGCGNSENSTEPETFTTTVVELPDGRSVTCVVWMGYRKGGPSCDWEGAR